MSNVEITGDESFEELEAKLALIEDESDEVIDPGAPVTAAATTQPAATQTGDKLPPVITEPASGNTPVGEVVIATAPTPGGESKAAVLTKDGVHTIPYEVLEATRERARLAEQRVQQLEPEAAKAAQLEQQMQSLKQRAVDAGADVSLLTEDGLTEEQLADLSEEYPALGRHLRALTKKIEAINSAPVVTSNAVTTGANTVDMALTHTPDLDGWRSNDPDRWDMALVIDSKLQKEPAFADKSLVQRFQEVQRRVKTAFGEVTPGTDQADIVAQAESKIAAAATKLPGSPSDLGSTVAHVPDKAAQIAAMDGNALLHSMNGMSDADIDNLLSSLEI